MIGPTKQKNVSTTKLSHKFGFSNPDEFENTVKCISNIYRQYSLEMISQSECLTHFAHFNTDFQQSVLDVYTVRRNEIEEFLINEHNARKNNLLTSFDWDVREVMGTSNSVSLRTQIATLIFNCKTNSLNHSYAEQKTIHMELTQQQITQLIDILEKCDEQLSKTTNVK